MFKQSIAFTVFPITSSVYHRISIPGNLTKIIFYTIVPIRNSPVVLFICPCQKKKKKFL